MNYVIAYPADVLEADGQVFVEEKHTVYSRALGSRKPALRRVTRLVFPPDLVPLVDKAIESDRAIKVGYKGVLNRQQVASTVELL